MSTPIGEKFAKWIDTETTKEGLHLKPDAPKTVKEDFERWQKKMEALEEIQVDTFNV